MKANELFEQIHSGEIKEDTQIDVINELTGQYITTIEFRNGMLNWEPGDFDTSFLCNIDIDFVVKENKGIEEINDTNYDENLTAKRIYHNFTRSKLNEVIRAVNKLTKESEEK